MKIIITVTTDIAFDQRVKRIATTLSRNGYEVCVYGRKKKMNHQLQLPFTYHLIHCWFARSFFFYAEYNLRLFFILLFSRFDLVCACDLDTLLSATLVSKWKKKKLIFDAHEYFEESIEIVNKKRIQRTWEWIARFCLPKTDQRYTVSQTLANELELKYGYPFLVIRNVPVSGDRPVHSTRHNIIWYQGAINEGRGLECMLECMNDLPGYSFYMAGDGDIVSALQNKVESLGLQDRVKFLGRLSYSEMQNYATTAFVGIDLLESVSKSYFVSLSNKTFDYMHAGLPLIQMQFPEYEDIHKKYPIGVLIPEVNKQNICDAIRHLENPEYYQKCLHACEEASGIYNWELEEKKLIELYKTISDAK